MQVDRSLEFDPNRRSFLKCSCCFGSHCRSFEWIGRLNRFGASDSGICFEGRRLLLGRSPWPVAEAGVRYMNIGTAGSMPVETLNVLDSENRRMARESMSGYNNFLDHGKLWPAASDAIPTKSSCPATHPTACATRFSGLSGCPGTRSSRPITNMAAAMFPWRSCRIVRRRRVIKRVTLPVGNKQTAEDYVELFSKAIGPRTKAMVFSAPTYKTGTMLPIKMLAKLAGKRAS